MKDIPIKAKVECVDGPCGESTAVIINPISQQVTHFVVLDRTVSKPMQRLVPVDQVEETSPTLIRLHCPKAELLNMEPFIEKRFIPKKQPDYSMYGGQWQVPVTTMVTGDAYTVIDEELIPPGELAVHRGDQVEASDGYVGTIGEFLVDPATEHITHLILQEGHLWGKREITLPVSAIDHIQAGTVYLKLDKQAIALLPAIPVKRYYDLAETDGKLVELVAKIFETPDEASQELEFVKGLHRQKTLKLLNAAIVVKDKAGKTSLKETEDVAPRQGRLFGAITGGLIGLLAGGPIGVVVGVLAGAGTGGLAAKWIDMGFSDKFLKNFQESLQPGNSALILLVEHEWTVKLSEALADREGIILQQTLTDEIVQQLLKGSETEA